MFHEDETEIEIRAVDLAGNASESLGRVTVTHRQERELMDVPVSMALGPTRAPRLVASGGVAFFGVAPRYNVLTPAAYSYLVAQPSWSTPVGLDVNAVNRPRLLRKLSSTGCGGGCTGQLRRAAGLGGRAGALTWVEEFFDAGGVPDLRTGFLSVPDSDGLPDLRNAALVSDVFVGSDLDGDIAPQFESCGNEGAAACRPLDSWSGRGQTPAPGSELGDNLLLARSTAIEPWPVFEPDTSSPVEVRTVVGPAIVFVHFLPAHRLVRVRGLRIALNAEPGTPSHPLAFRVGNDGKLSSDGVDFVNDLVSVTRATGTGFEELRFTRYTVTPFDADENGYALGVFVPDGSGVDVPLYAFDAAAFSTADAASTSRPLGMQVWAAPPSPPLPIDIPAASISLETDRLPRIWSLREDRDGLFTGVHTGIAALRLDHEGSLPPAPRQVAIGEVDDALPEWNAFDMPAAQARQTAASREGLGVPQSCAIVFETEVLTTLRDIRVEGEGALDILDASLFRSSDGTPGGLFQPVVLERPSPTAGYVISGADQRTALYAEGAPDSDCAQFAGALVLSDSVSFSAPTNLVDTGTLSGTRAAPAIQIVDSYPYQAAPVELAVVNVTEGET